MTPHRNHLFSRLTGFCLAVFFALTMISFPSTASWAEEAKKAEKAEKAEAKINLNTATVEELSTLSGIGRTKAAAIVKYREEVAPFKSVEEVQKVKGIGKKIFEKIEDLITV